MAPLPTEPGGCDVIASLPKTEPATGHPGLPPATRSDAFHLCTRAARGAALTSILAPPRPPLHSARMFAWLRNLFTAQASKPDLSQAPDEPVPTDRVPETRPEDYKPWIGVDLDGTLAAAVPWKGIAHIGPAVPLMLRRVKAWVDKGVRVKIMTARAGDPEGIAATKLWLVAQGLPELEVTDRKDFGMIELWDDRAIQVVQNSGICFLGTSYFARPKAPILSDEVADRTFILVGSEPKGTDAAPSPKA